MSIDSGSLYDLVPYDGGALAGCHLNSIAVASLFAGFVPTPPSHSRVLEIGCGVGSTLLSNAATYPSAQCIGLDASALQIKIGRDFAAAAGIRNAEFHHMSVMDIPQSFGKFDYIICHGVWAVVAPDIQDQILRTAHDFLAPNGLALITYNTLPGWHWKRALRDMLQHHVSHLATIQEKITSARAFLTILNDSFGPSNTTPFGQFIRKENDHFKHATDAYIFHEYIADNCLPIYFKDFITRADNAGLQYVAESSLARNSLDLISPTVAKAIQDASTSRIELEQHLDFVNHCAFRTTVLCHKGHAIHGKLKPDPIRSLYIACAAKPEKNEDLQRDETSSFIWPSGNAAGISGILLKNAIACLGAIYPRAMSFSELIHSTSKQISNLNLPAITPENDRGLASNLLEGYLRQIVELHYQRPPSASVVTSKPVVWPIARIQAMHTDRIINTRNVYTKLKPFERFIITLLDGTRDLDALTEAALTMTGNGQYHYSLQFTSDIDQNARRHLIKAHIQTVLDALMRHAMLVA